MKCAVMPKGWMVCSCLFMMLHGEVTGQYPGRPRVIHVGGKEFQTLTDLHVTHVDGNSTSIIRATGGFSGITFLEYAPSGKKIPGAPFSQSDVWGLQLIWPGGILNGFEFITVEDHPYFPGGPVVAGTEDYVIGGVTVTSSGNVDPFFSPDGQVLSNGISNAVYPLLDGEMQLLGFEDIGGSGRVDARDISVQTNQTAENWMALGTFTGSVEIPESGSGTEVSQVTTLTSSGDEDAWVAHYHRADCAGSSCELTGVTHISSIGGIFPSVGIHAVPDGEAPLGENGGRVLIAGYFEAIGTRQITFGPSHVRYGIEGQDGFVAEYDSMATVNSIIIGGPGDESVTGVAVDGSGNIYLTGYYTDSLDLDPGDRGFPYPAKAAGIFLLPSTEKTWPPCGWAPWGAAVRTRGPMWP